MRINPSRIYTRWRGRRDGREIVPRFVVRPDGEAVVRFACADCDPRLPHDEADGLALYLGEVEEGGRIAGITVLRFVERNREAISAALAGDEGATVLVYERWAHEVLGETPDV